MSMLNQLAEDFDLFLEDWAEEIVITHITSQSLNVNSGNYTNVTQTSTVNAIINTISKKDILFNPSKYLSSDLAIFCKIEDCETEPKIGEKITYNSINYIILETQLLKEVIKMIVRK